MTINTKIEADIVMSQLKITSLSQNITKPNATYRYNSDTLLPHLRNQEPFPPFTLVIHLACGL